MKRTWMLLFVIALLAIFMAVPAMAAEHDHTGWPELEAGMTINADNNSGNYVVPAGFDGSVTVDGAVTVTICMNGNDWNCAGKTTRPLTIQGGATVTLCDCTETPATLTGGTVAADGASIYIDSSTLTITDITVTGGRAVSGELEDSSDPSGGNIRGVGTSPKLYLGNEDGTGAPTISNGYCEENGGNINCSNVTIYNANIIDGEAGNASGNLQASTLLTMHDGLISGGVCRRNADGSLGTSGFAITAYNVFNTHITMSGGTIKGGVHGQNKFNISGTATIEDTSKTTAGLNFSGDSGTFNIDETDGAFDGKIVFYASTGNNRKITTNLTTERMEALMDEGKLVLNNTTRILHSEYDTSGSDGSITAKYIYVRPATWYCMCGYTKSGSTKTAHESWCNKVDLPWIALTTARLDTSGNYYVTDNMAFSQQNIGSKGSNMTINLDLNGKTWIRTSGRLGRVFGKGSTFSITDTSNEQTGLMQTTWSEAHTNQGGMFWFSSEYSKDGSEVCFTMNLYAGSLVVNGYGSHAGVFGNNTGLVEGSGYRPFVVNMYGGSIDGADSTGKAGGVTILMPYQVFNMYAGTITGGTADNGGAIGIYGGTFNMHGGTIENCNAVKNGGAVYMRSGNLNVQNGATIQNCSSTEHGGAICLADDATNAINMTGGTIQSCVSGGMGGAVYVGAGSSFTMSGNSLIDQCTSNYDHLNLSGGAVFVYGSTDDAVGYTTSFTMNGGTISNGTATTGNGGNVYVRDYATFTMNGGTISNGSASNEGGNIYCTNNGITNLNGGAISGAESGSGVLVRSTLNLNGTLTFSGNADFDIRVSNKFTIGENFANGRNDPIMIDRLGSIGNVTASMASVERAEEVIGEFVTTEGYTINISDSNTLHIAEGAWGVTINGINYGIGAAIEKSEEGAVLNLNGAYTGDVTVGKNVILNLNGNTITGNINVADGVTLKLADSTAVGYTEGTGAVTGTITGTIARTFTTGTGSSMGGNYRFLVLKAGNTYTSHRIYLAVKSTVLVPDYNGSPAVKYRTYFKCDSTVAGYVNAEGGAYGVQILKDGVAAAMAPYTADVVAGDVNDRVTGMTNLLTKEENKGENNYSACAYITLTDDFAEGNETITSAATTKYTTATLKSLVVAANEQNLTAAQTAAMKVLCTNWTDIVSGWIDTGKYLGN